jgi:hypothetical protein
MSNTDMLNQLIFGILLGALGQGLRSVVGLKKAAQSAAAAGQSFSDTGFDAARLIVSLLIGGIVGGLTIMTLTGFKVVAVDQNMILKIIAAGYAGTDAIEGLLQQYLPSGGAKASVAARRPLFVAAPNTLLTSSNAVPSKFSSLAAPAALASDSTLQVELDVSYAVFPACGTPQPGGRVNVDTNFPIADQCAASPGNIALDVNSYANELATANGLKWSGTVLSTDIQGLTTVRTLMDLIGKNLSS